MAKYVIHDEFLQQIERLQMLIKNNIAGQFGGNRKSKTFGSSCEFADYRDYIPGDDIMRIDWNAYARFEKLYQKLYYDERQMHTRIYIDASRSMEHGKGEKAEQALRISATLAYMSVCEMDKASVYVIRDKQLHEVFTGIVGKDAFFSAVAKLNEVEFSGDSYISDAVIPSNVGRGDGLSVIISDFLTDNNFEDAINHLADKKRDILCMQILSREEVKPLLRGKMLLFDSESSSRTYKRNIDREIAQAYKKALEYTINRIKKHCVSRGAEYMFVEAEASMGDLFFEKMVNVGVLK